jgi:hypothetical protein
MLINTTSINFREARKVSFILRSAIEMQFLCLAVLCIKVRLFTCGHLQPRNAYLGNSSRKSRLVCLLVFMSGTMRFSSYGPSPRTPPFPAAGVTELQKHSAIQLIHKSQVKSSAADHDFLLLVHTAWRLEWDRLLHLLVIKPAPKSSSAKDSIGNHTSRQTLRCTRLTRALCVQCSGHLTSLAS